MIAYTLYLTVHSTSVEKLSKWKILNTKSWYGLYWRWGKWGLEWENGAQPGLHKVVLFLFKVSS